MIEAADLARRKRAELLGMVAGTFTRRATRLHVGEHLKRDRPHAGG
jgi:hypothetical protein